jgi:hypothetical protein
MKRSDGGHLDNDAETWPWVFPVPGNFGFLYKFTLIRAHTNFHDTRSTPSVREVRETEEKERKNKVLIEATTFAKQPVCNAARAAHALRSTNSASLWRP